jgi:hypothetical protein
MKMKNTLKFNVGVRLALAIALCFSFKAHASEKSQRIPTYALSFPQIFQEKNKNISPIAE